VVLKPSELTPLTSLELAELAADLLPPGVARRPATHGALGRPACVRLRRRTAVIKVDGRGA
jgi:hypothetical protein